MTPERIKEILIGYVDNDLESADPDYVREVLYDLCSKEELEELGFWDWLCFEDFYEEVDGDE